MPSCRKTFLVVLCSFVPLSMNAWRIWKLSCFKKDVKSYFAREQQWQNKGKAGVVLWAKMQLQRFYSFMHIRTYYSLCRKLSVSRSTPTQGPMPVLHFSNGVELNQPTTTLVIMCNNTTWYCASKLQSWDNRSLSYSIAQWYYFLYIGPAWLSDHSLSRLFLYFYPRLKNYTWL